MGLGGEEYAKNTGGTYGYHQRVLRSLSLAQPTGSWTNGYGYDALLRLAGVTSPAGTFTYSYNGAGRQINGLTLPGSGNEIDYTYDGAGGLLSTALKHGATVLDGYTYTYNANGNRTSVTRADNAYVNYGYDGIGQLTKAQGFEAGGLLRGNENFGYGYDPAGNLLLRTNNTLVQTFTTDNANELLSVSRNNNLLTIVGSLTNHLSALKFDGQNATIYHDLTFAVTNGILLNDGLNVFTTVVSSVLTVKGTITNHLPVTVTLANDANGNLISDGLHGYEYDCANELTGITVTNQLKTEFVYDGFAKTATNGMTKATHLKVNTG